MADSSGIRMLDPETVSRIGSIDLIAHSLVEGFLVGLHRSPYHGFSVEFADPAGYDEKPEEARKARVRSVDVREVHHRRHDVETVVHDWQPA